MAIGLEVTVKGPRSYEEGFGEGLLAAIELLRAEASAIEKQFGSQGPGGRDAAVTLGAARLIVDEFATRFPGLLPTV